MQSLHRVSFAVAALAAVLIGAFLWSKLVQYPDMYTPHPTPPTLPRLKSPSAPHCRTMLPPNRLPDAHLDEAPFLRPPSTPRRWMEAAEEDRQYSAARSRWYLPWSMCRLAYYALRSGHRGEQSLDIPYAECRCSIGELRCVLDDSWVQSDALKTTLSAVGGSVKRNLGLIARHLRAQCTTAQEFNAAARQFNALMAEAQCADDCVLPTVFIDPQPDVGECVMRMLLSLAGRAWTHDYSCALVGELRKQLDDVAKAVMPLLVIRLTRVSWRHLFLATPAPQDVQQLALHGTASCKLVRDGLLHDIYRVADHASGALSISLNDRQGHRRLTKHLRDMANGYIKKHTVCPGHALARPLHLCIRFFDPAHSVPPILSDHLL